LGLEISVGIVFARLLWDVGGGMCEVRDWGLRLEISVGIVFTMLLLDIRGGRCEVGD
jgi:hypothetical protein